MDFRYRSDHPEADHVEREAHCAFNIARENGLTHKAAKVKTAAHVRRVVPNAVMEAALPRLKALGVMSYGVTLRALRLNRHKAPSEGPNAEV